MQTEHQVGHFAQNGFIKTQEDMSDWCEELNLRADELKHIINTVGPHIEAVRDYLARRSMKRESPF